MSGAPARGRLANTTRSRWARARLHLRRGHQGKGGPRGVSARWFPPRRLVVQAFVQRGRVEPSSTAFAIPRSIRARLEAAESSLTRPEVYSEECAPLLHDRSGYLSPAARRPRPCRTRPPRRKLRVSLPGDPKSDDDVDACTRPRPTTLREIFRVYSEEAARGVYCTGSASTG